MKISFLKHGILLVSLCGYTLPTLADGVASKSLLVSISVPVIAGIYSFSIGDIEGLKELAIASAINLQVTTLLKNTVHRHRPNGQDDLSFPSGHTSACFTGASYMDHRYGLVWGLPMYAIGAAVGYQRVNVKKHYWSDVIAGAALGYLAGALFTVKYPNVWLEPEIDVKNKSYGLKFKMNLD